MKTTEDTATDLSKIVSARLADISPYKSQKEVAIEVGFPSTNMLSIIKKGNAKLSLDRISPLAKALEVELPVLMMPALRQYYSENVIADIRDTFSSAESKAELEILNLARKHLKNKNALSFETREKLKEIFAENKPASA